MNPHVPHWSNLNCVQIHEMILRVLFGGKTHAFEVSQPRYLENPLATVRVAKSAAKSSSPCRKYVFFSCWGRRKGKCVLWSGLTLPALPRALLDGGVGRSPGLCMHGASQSRLSCLPLLLPATLSSETRKSQKRSVFRERDGGFPSDAASHASPSQRRQAWQGTAPRLLLAICF